MALYCHSHLKFQKKKKKKKKSKNDHLQLALYTIYIVIRMAGHTKFEDDQLQLASW